ncbi:DNA polymerase-1 [Phytomonospora endophytica]|uniref:DNA-directed DNA polymerase n=2 Tax=Phytomonospora endophytica TaxID=714109 RepID=A0A841FCA0_9ACTN|nr:DNA polymerase-1 [Phytomonospora endophytica]
MRMLVVPGAGNAAGSGWLRAVGDDGRPLAPATEVPDLAAELRRREAAESPRWILADIAHTYPPLYAAGARLGRCHDLVLAEGVLLGFEGRYGETTSVAAAYARGHGLPVPVEEPERVLRQETLFTDEKPRPSGREETERLTSVYADQVRRAAAGVPGLATLVAAESAGGLVAAEMTAQGLPFRRTVHDELLTGLLGPKPFKGMRPRLLQELADRISAAFGKVVNPDSPQQIVAAFKAAGKPVESTRSYVLKQVDHPAVEPLLQYKELARIWVAHGWTWAEQWVGAGPTPAGQRLRPEYVVGGVVSGRWATNGGAALQIPKAVRRAVTADDGWRLVVADAAQLEPRVLAAMSGDAGMARAAGEIDLYAALSDAFGGKRDGAKIALLSAMYGGGSTDALSLLAVMRQRFPVAYAYVESAAQAGEQGKLVRSWLGRTCPPASSSFKSMGAGPEAARAVRDRGRFTRNFVVQGTAAEWALALLAFLRRRLHEEDLGELVFFQHDEVIVHCPERHAARVHDVIDEAALEATVLLFPGTPVRIPMQTTTVSSYADAK